MKRCFQKILALVLALCCLLGSIPLSAAEELPQELVDAPIVTTDKNHIIGRFLKEGGMVFVSAETLKQMAPGTVVQRTEDGYDFLIGRSVPLEDGQIRDSEWVGALLPLENARYVDGAAFVPFLTAMDWLRLNPVVVGEPDVNADTGIVAAADGYEQGWLAMLEAGDVHELGFIMEDIFSDPSLCMRYWKESESYRRDVFLAEAISALRDLSLFSFVSGESTLESYQDAFAKLIKPQSEEEVDFSTGADESLGMLNTLFAIGEDVGPAILKALDLNAPSVLKTAYKAVSAAVDGVVLLNESLGIDEKLELFAYADAMRQAEETILRGLREIASQAPGVSQSMADALANVLESYDGGLPLWEQSFQDVQGESISTVESLLTDLLPHSYLVTIGNSLTTFFLDTGNQLEATANASRFLDIQTCCEQLFEEFLPRYQDAAREGKGRYLRILCDVTNLYLLSGIRAQEAMAQADGMHGVTSYCISRLKDAQKKMARFSEMDLLCYENYAAAAHWVRSLQPVPRKTDALAYYPTNEPLFITITWDPEVNGQLMDMTANITGVTDDGAAIYRAPTEGEYTSQSGPVAVHSDNGLCVELEILRHDTVLDVTAEYGDVMPFGAPTYQDAHVEIWLNDAQGNIIAVIAANPDTSVYTDSPYMMDESLFLARGGTGVSYFQLRLDHGVLKSPFSDAPAIPEPGQNAPADDPVAQQPTDKRLMNLTQGGWTDEHYTADGQLQSSKSYNADGYMTANRWYENGECTAYTLWSYNEHNHLTRICFANMMEPDEVKLIFENLYSDGQLVKVELYNFFGTLLGEGRTAADAADAVGMRMLVEESLPR